MNTFFALEIPPAIRDEIAEQVGEWRDLCNERDAYLWVSPTDYHITLFFLGNLNETGQERAIQNALPVAMAMRPFSVQLAPAGFFKKNPGAGVDLWLGIRKSDALAAIALDLRFFVNSTSVLIDNPLRSVNSMEQSYKPHIKIGRGGLPPSYYDLKMRYDHPFPQWQADRFVLMETLPPNARQNSQNMRYNIVHAFPFSEEAV